MDWLGRDAVQTRLGQLVDGHVAWARRRNSKRHFPGGPYVLLHTLSHLLIQSLSMRCGYPAASIRERIYADYDGKRFALLLYTASPDAEGTLGGLVQEARRVEDHLRYALESAALCSNDPVCAEHVPGQSMEERCAARRGLPWLRADRGNFLRDAQRVPGPRAGRPGAVRPKSRVLRRPVIAVR